MSGVQSTVQYRDIQGFPGYRVGDDGSVWSCRDKGGWNCRGKTFVDWRRKDNLKPTKSGHIRVSLMVDNKLRLVAVHKLVLLAFVGPCPKGMQGCHFPDRNPTNNRLENLRWDTAKGNQNDRVIHGTDSRGERNGRSKLTAHNVDAIRTHYADGSSTLKKLAEQFGVSATMIGYIVRGQNWK